MPIKAVFWDIDGTIVMSEPLHNEKIRFIATSNGVVLTEEHVASFQGIGDIRVHEALIKLGMPGTLEMFLQACEDYYLKQVHTVEVREGFAQAFTHFSKVEIFQSVVSNGLRPLVHANLERAGVRDQMVSIIDADHMLERGLMTKPAPDPYLEALREVNEIKGTKILSHECLVVEDSPAGVQSGKAAGMKTIFWKLSEDTPSLSIADHEAFTGDQLMGIVRGLCL